MDSDIFDKPWSSGYLAKDDMNAFAQGPSQPLIGFSRTIPFTRTSKEPRTWNTKSLTCNGMMEAELQDAAA